MLRVLQCFIISRLRYPNPSKKFRTTFNNILKVGSRSKPRVDYVI